MSDVICIVLLLLYMERLQISVQPRIENFSTRIAQNIKNNAPQKLPLLVEKCINSTSTIGRECISNCSYP